MPKSFTEAEKAYIRERLLREAEACLGVYGIRRTTVDELVRRAGIPKGTFYLFYESKEALIFDVILKLNAEIQANAAALISNMRAKPDAEELTEIVFGLYQSLDGSFLLKLLESGELEFLMQNAPAGIRAGQRAGRRNDDRQADGAVSRDGCGQKPAVQRGAAGRVSAAASQK